MYNLRKTKKINWFVLGLVALPFFAIGGYFWATGIISALEKYRSPLQNSAPHPGQDLGEPLTKRVVIVLMDALRYDTSTLLEVMPVLNQLRAENASAIMTSRPPSFSAPGWTCILTGAWPDINDSQPFNPPDIEHVRTFTQDDIFAAGDRAGLNTAISGYSWFEQMLANSGVDAQFYTPDEDNAADQEVVVSALPWLTADYQLILIHIDQIDYAGHHEGGPIDPNWDAAATRADTLLGRIVAQLDLEVDTIMVISDHGQINKGGHGGNEPITMIEPFVLAGKGVRPGFYNEIKMVDIAPTVAVLLGTNIPASSQGRPLFEILELQTDQASIILEAEKAQQSALLVAYSDAINQPVKTQNDDVNIAATQIAMEKARMTRLAQERIWRNMISLFLAIVPGYFLFLRKEKKIIWMFGGSLIYLTIFNLRYAVLDKNPYGLSWIPGLMDFILYVALTSGISLVIAWLATMFGLHAFRKPPRQSAGMALGIVWFVLYILSIPILLNFAVNGIVTTWTLPEFTIQYLGFFALFQSMFVAIIGLVLVGLSALIGKFRHINLKSHPVS
jgi:hypothetical protein